MGKLDGRIAIITGAAAGMGAASAKLFAKEGAKVVMGDINVERLNATAEEIGENAVAIKLDVSKAEDWANALAVAHEKFGKVSAVVNCAGICDNPSVEEMTEERYMRSMNINSTSVFLSYKTVYEDMKELNGGSIVNISSTAGAFGLDHGLSYCASKHAMIGLTKAAAIEFGKNNVRVNAILPGSISTDLLWDSIKETPHVFEALSAQTPLHRVGNADEIANTVLFLISDDSSYISGATLLVDGGMYA